MSSEFLFARPSFLTGMARVLDLWGRFDRYNESRTPEEADVRALVSDWMVVRRDLEDALRKLLAERPELVEELARLAETLPQGQQRGRLTKPETARQMHE